MTFFKRALRTPAKAIAIASVGLLAACSGSGEAPPPDPDASSTGRSAGSEPLPAEPAAAQSSVAPVAWSRRVDVLGQPADAGRTVLILVRTGGGVALRGLDKKTGRTTFSTPFDPGGTPPGVAMSPKVTRTDKGRVLALTRRTGSAPLQAVDVRTGAVVKSTPVAIDDYDACSDGTDVCWSGYEGGSDKFGPLPGGGPTRWDLETGRLLENDGQDAAQLVGDPDLYVRGEGRTASIMRLPGSQRSRWSQSVSLAVAPGANPDYGWSFEHDEESDVYVGSLGRPPAPGLVRAFRAGKRVEVDYTKRYLTVALDGRSGEQLWSRRGANPWCPLLRSVDGLDTRTLCVVEGSSVQREGREPRNDDLAVELQGVDPRSGDVGWTFELAGEEAAKAYEDERVALAPYGLVLPTPDGPVALDMRTGEQQVVAEDTVLLCTAGADRITVNGVDRTAGDLYRACTSDGRPASERLSTFGATGIDGEGDTRYVSMPGRIVAFRLS